MAPLSPSPAGSRSSRIPFWAALALVAVADLGLTAFGLTQLGVKLSPGPGSFAVFWPGTGLMLGALLLSPPRRWPALVGAAAAPIIAFAMATGQPLPPVAALALGNALEAVLGAFIALRLCGGRPDITRLTHLSALVLAGPVLATGVACAITAAALILLGGAALTARPFLHIQLSLWAGSALGSIAVAPVLLAWAEPPHLRLDPRLTLETLAVASIFVGIVWLAFGPVLRVMPVPLSLFLPLLFWSTLRFGLRGATASGLVLATTILWATAHRLGWYAVGSGARGTMGAQIYCAVTLFSMLGMASVVESRRRGAEALRRSEQQLRLVRFATDATTDPLACLDAAGTFVHANDALCAASHRDRAAIVGRPAWSLLPTLDAATWRRHWEAVKRLGAVTAEVTAAIEGGPVPFEIRSSYLCFDGQEFCVAAARDLRDRRQAEAALRLASIGTMAAGMAHEINNPLACVLANLEWLSETVRCATAADAGAGPETPAGAALRAIDPALSETAESASRIRDVVRDLKLFSRSAGEAERPAPADVVRALRGAVTLAQHEIRHRARLAQEYEDVPPVQGDEHRLGQVFLNLILNAAQAIPDGHLSGNLVRVAARRGGGGEVLVEVEDTGCGIGPEVLARIFDPFFTTKPVGIGTGLGLSICHGIVTSAGGRIEVSSRPGHGSLFRVRLPISEGGTSSSEERLPAVEAPGQRRRILVVDDDPAIGRVLGRVLPEHDVQGCISAAEALRRAAAERFDVILCDLMMPEMTGMEFHERLARSVPGLAARTIFVTGGPFTPAASAFLERTANSHLPKPFDTAVLRAEIERVVRRAPDRSTPA